MKSHTNHSAQKTRTRLIHKVF